MADVNPPADPPAQEEAHEPAIPEQLPVLALPGLIVFPGMAVPLTVREQNDIRLVDDALAKDHQIAVACSKTEEGSARRVEDVHAVGAAGLIVKMLRFPDGSTRILLQGLKRISIDEQAQSDPYLVANVQALEDHEATSDELDALVDHVSTQFQQMISMVQQLPDELKIAVMNVKVPGQLADLVAANLKMETQERQAILEQLDVKERLELVAGHLKRHLRVLELSSEINSQVQEEMGKNQREYYLREQLKAIQKELGEDDDTAAEVEELRKRLQEAQLPEEAQKEADRELGRLKRMHPSSAEYSVARTYIDWLITLPWAKSTRDRLSIKKAKQILDQDHYDLAKVKERILEYLAVRKLKRDMKGPILCFAGPPGTGKTSMGRSIARAIGREFIRLSLGGVRDEAEVRGHRRTYVGALPGRIIQGLRKAATNNPVFMLDEIDKLGSDFRGDPSSALLEVLDPEQNNSFADHYLDVPFDLSKVMFITTANVLDTIPPPLRDRMEILELPGYTTEEKVSIAQQYLIPKQIKEHGLKKNAVEFEPAAIEGIIASYTREAGLRNLEREIANVCRKIARKVAEGEKGPHLVTDGGLQEFLGPVKFFPEVVERTSVTGVSVGLAWTQAGGEILFLESTRMPGSGRLNLTGSLGDVMKESAEAAMSYVRSRAKELGLAKTPFAKTDVHIHVPAGAIPKDGPSAGVAITTSLISLFSDQPIKPFVAMTGEISLRGQVLPVGGIKEKVLAARRAHIETVILPARNEKDLVEVPENAKKDLTFKFVERIDEVLALAFAKTPGAKTPSSGKGKKRA